MTVEDLFEQIQSALQPVLDKVQETPTYNQLKDRFDGLSLTGQRGVVAAAIIFSFLIVLSIPYGWYSDSETTVEEFNLRRETLRDLFRTSKELSDTPSIPVAPSAEALRMDLENRLRELDVLPEQIINVSANESSSSRLIPHQRSSGGLTAQLKKLNLDQIVHIGTALSQMGVAVKLTGLRIEANAEEAGYFDATYTVATLDVPDLNSPEESSSKKGRR